MSNGKPICEKSILFKDFLSIFGDDYDDGDVVCFQRHLSESDRKTLRERFKESFSVVEAEDQAKLVSEILGLDGMLTISTTTAHIAACFEVPVILLAANVRDRNGSGALCSTRYR
jgi:hypothetical protein